MNKLLKWDVGNGRNKMLDSLTLWEKAIERWELRGGEMLQDSVKQSVISERAPAEVKSHLLLNASKFKTYEQMKALLLDYLTEIDDTGDPDISYMYGNQSQKKGKGKGKDKGKTKGKPKGKGKGKGKQPGGWRRPSDNYGT